MRLRIYIFLIALMSCSKGQFSGSNEQQNSQDSVAPVTDDSQVILEEINQGLSGGHFDLDTSTQVYSFDQGETDGHVHAYDDKYGLNGVDFLDIKDKKLVSLDRAIGEGIPFKVVISNSQLSPRAFLSINGQQYAVDSFQSEFNAQETYIFGEQENLEARTLESMSLAFPVDAIVSGGLISTSTDCVRQNTPGKNEEYRNGALLIQVVRADSFQINRNHGSVESGLLWEASIFWHKDSHCFI